MKHLVLIVSACAALVACSEKPQVSGTRKADVAAFNGTDTAYMAQGWKPGDQASWETQLKNRAQGQNENSRATP